MTEEKSEALKFKETMYGKISELDALNLEKDKCPATLEAEMKQLKEKYEAETEKIRRTSVEAVVNFELENVRRKML